MLKYFLVLRLYGDAIAIIPDKYDSIEQCEKAGQAYQQNKGQYFNCIPANKTDKPSTCESLGVGTNTVICK